MSGSLYISLPAFEILSSLCSLPKIGLPAQIFQIRKIREQSASKTDFLISDILYWLALVSDRASIDGTYVQGKSGEFDRNSGRSSFRGSHPWDRSIFASHLATL